MIFAERKKTFASLPQQFVNCTNNTYRSAQPRQCFSILVKPLSKKYQLKTRSGIRFQIFNCKLVVDNQIVASNSKMSQY